MSTVAKHSIMGSIMLSNVPCADLAAGQGTNIYLYFDAVGLSDLYQCIILPWMPPAPLAYDCTRQPNHHLIHGALSHCWINAKTTQFLPQLVLWPFQNTLVEGLDLSRLPLDLGLLDPEDIDVEVVLAMQDEATCQAQPTQASSSFLWPQVSNIQTHIYRLDIPTKLGKILHSWHMCCCKIFNNTARQVNTTSNPCNLPDERALYPLLADNKSPFVERHLYLAKCPCNTHCIAVDQAVSARKSILTCHFNTLASQQGTIPSISLSMADKDQKQGFAIWFSSHCSKIHVPVESLVQVH